MNEFVHRKEDEELSLKYYELSRQVNNQTEFDYFIGRILTLLELNTCNHHGVFFTNCTKYVLDFIKTNLI